VVRYEVKVGAYNPAKNIVELEGLDDTFAQTVSRRCFDVAGCCHVHVVVSAETVYRCV